MTTITGLERFTPLTHEAIQKAQVEAVRMHARSVDPEHLLLGILLQGDEQVMTLLCHLGIDMQYVCARVADITQAHTVLSQDESDLPLSRDTQECLGWALSFISYMHVSSVCPEHLLLGVLRHQRTQPLLSFLLPSIEMLQTRISEEIGPAYTSFIDQLIRTRIRDQSIVSYKRGIIQRVLRRYERPSLTFSDVIELNGAASTLREAVDYLQATPRFQLSGGRFPHGILFAGSSGNEKRFLVYATAGEAVVPLITLSLSALAEMLADLHSGIVRLEDLELPMREYNLLKRGTIPEKGARYIQYLFQEAKNVSPSILSIEDVGVVARIRKEEGRDQVLRQLLVEMDGLDKHYRMVVIAGTNQPDELDPALLKTGRFERMIVLGGGHTVQSQMPMFFCPTCKHEIQPDWQYCVYCGRSLAKACTQCGSPYPRIEGAHFCARCGCSLV